MRPDREQGQDPRPAVCPPLRLFLALWPGAAVRRELAARRDRIDWRRGAAPVADARLHLTLHFLGDVDAAAVPGLRAALWVPVPRFELVLDQAAVWPGGLAVLQPSQPPAPLAALHAALAAALLAAGLPVESRRFRPHVTLAQRAAGAEPTAPAPLRWPVDGYVLVHSQRAPPARYERLWHRRAH
jgi:2'-5' RNA ligase